MRSLWLLALLALPRTADASTCAFYSGGTIHQQIPLGCPVITFQGSEPDEDPTSYWVHRNGETVELAVTSVTRHEPRTLPVEVTVSTPPACDYHFETEDWPAWGSSLEIAGLAVGDVVASGSVIVAAGPCPTELDAPTNTGWLQCTPPNDFERCCEEPGAMCYPEDDADPPPIGSDDKSGGCATSSPSLGIALVLALLALRRPKNENAARRRR